MVNIKSQKELKEQKKEEKRKLHKNLHVKDKLQTIY
tara:strand:- start:434 stop:541 length:108 start_codon:yes stop_codon:yes gene_type:complete